VVLGAIEGVGDGASAGIAHGADESVTARDFILGDFEEVDAFESELRGPLAELFEWSVFVTPTADGLVDAPFARSGVGGFAMQWK
jgi:hypothetical protein